MLRKFRDFDQMITPTLIRVIYYIGLVFVGLASLAILFGSIIDGQYIGILVALLVFLFGILMVRVYCELIMVGFKILENLRDINLKMDRKASGDAAYTRSDREDTHLNH